MSHPAGYALPQSYITEADPQTVANVCDEVLRELDAARYNSYSSHIEERLDRLELVVLTMATAIKNGSMG